MTGVPDLHVTFYVRTYMYVRYVARAGIARETMKQCVVVGFQDQVCRIGKVSFLLLLLHLDVQQNKPEKSYNCACK